MTRRSWLIASGDLLFKYRNALFPAVIIAVALGMRPRVLFGDPALDGWLGTAGVVSALLGEMIRLTTIGFEYIERGGKNRQVWASRLVQGGVYGLSRNPMYVGNVLIVIGMCLIARAPLSYVTIIPLFFYIYLAIVATEERFLRSKFSDEFEAYCRRVPRFLPSFKGFPASFKGMRYNWRRAIRQDLSTLIGVALGLALFPLWRRLWLGGQGAWRIVLPEAVMRLAAILACYGVLYVMKRRHLLHEPGAGR